MAAAQIIKSGLCRTTAKCRPNPTMFFMPGLNTQPWYGDVFDQHCTTVSPHSSTRCVCVCVLP